MTNEERLKAAGWRNAPREYEMTPYRWTLDGIDWYTEDEALVAAVTAERDAAIVRAEAAETALAEVDMIIGIVGADRDCRRMLLCADRERMRTTIARAEADRTQLIAVANYIDAFCGHANEWGDYEHVAACVASYCAGLKSRAEAAEALAASRLDVSPELACGWLSERLGGPATSAVFAALRAHAAKVSR